MANPFLVLGGIAVGIITASFGVLQVPGWVASAQDASAINDLRMISEAQAASASLKGEYAGEIATLQGGGLGLSFAVPDERVKHFAADGDGWCSVALSDSGRYFGASDVVSKATSAETLDAAIAAVCQGQPDEGEREEPKKTYGPATDLSGTVSLSGGATSAIAFTPDGRTAFVAARGGTVLNAIDVASQNVTPLPVPAGNYQMDMSPDGTRVAVASSGELRVYDTRTFELVNQATTGYGVQGVAWSANNSTLVTLRNDGQTYRLESYTPDTLTKTSSMRVTGTSGRLSALPDGRFVAWGSSIETIILDPAAGTKVVLTSESSRVAVAPDGNIWVEYNGLVRLLDADTHTVLEQFRVSHQKPGGMVISPDGRWLYVQTDIGVTVFGAETKGVTDEIPIASSYGGALGLSPDGSTLYVSRGTPMPELTVFSASELR